MRVAVFTEKSYSFLFDAWVRAIPRLRTAGHDVVGLYMFPPVLGKRKGLDIYRYYLATFGPWVFLRLARVALASRFRQLGRALSAGLPWTYRGLGRKFDVEVREATSPNREEVVEWIKRGEVDVIWLSAGYIVKEPLLRSARLGILNRHSALLPAFRGLLPVFWTLMDGTTPVGASVHVVDEGIDTGEVLYQKSYRLPARASVVEYYRAIFDDLPEAMLASLEILDGRQSKQLVPGRRPPSYFSAPSRTDFIEVSRRGCRIV